MTLRRVAALCALLVAVTGCGSTAAPEAAQQTPRDAALHDLLPDDVAERGVLRVGTDASYPPASSFAKDGRTVVGFEPDLMAAVGRVLGLRVEMVAEPFDGLVDSVQQGELDLAVSSITDTQERQAQVDFVDYFSAGTSIVVRRGNPEGILELSDLCGKRVAVERATVQVDLLARAQPRCGGRPIIVAEYPDNAQALLELRTGRASAVLNDFPPAVELSTGERTRGYYQLAADTQYEPGLYGMAVGKERAALRDAVHGALERVIDSGEYQRVLDGWDVSSGGVEAPSVNGAAAAG